MRTVTETMIIPCSAATFWRVFLDPAYTRALYMEALKFRSFDVVEITPTARKLALVPKTKLPAVIEKLIGDGFAYEDHGSFNATRDEWSWRMNPPSKAKPKKEIVATNGSIRITPVSDTECRRLDTCSVEGKIFGLGGIIESSVEKELHNSWTAELAFLKQWLAKLPATA